jgi:hypothetical protein
MRLRKVSSLALLGDGARDEVDTGSAATITAGQEFQIEANNGDQFSGKSPGCHGK